MGFIDPDTIVSVLGRLYNYTVIRIADIKPNPELLKLLPYELAKSSLVFPLEYKDEELSVTMVEPTDTAVVEDLQRKTGKTIRVCVSTENDVIQAFRDFYKISDEEYKKFLHFDDDFEDNEPVTSVDDFGSLVSEAAEEIEVGSGDMDDYQDEFMASDAPIIKLVNGILTKAINDGVSDIHIELFEKTFQVRYRLDGSMYKAMNLPLSIKNAVISRIKILAELDIAEKRIPQDGRIKLRFRQESLLISSCVRLGNCMNKRIR